MGHVFISYSRKDRAFAENLASALLEVSLDVFLDVDDIRAGEKWSTAIQRGLDAAEIMLLIVSPDSMQSVNVEDEWQYFLDNQKPILPILWRPAKLHFQLNRLQYVNFYEVEPETAYAHLLAELRRRGVRLTSPAAPPPKTPSTQKSNGSLTPSDIGKKWWAGVLIGVVALTMVVILVINGLLNNGDDGDKNTDKGTDEATELVSEIATEISTERPTEKASPNLVTQATDTPSPTVSYTPSPTNTLFLSPPSMPTHTQPPTTTPTRSPTTNPTNTVSSTTSHQDVDADGFIGGDDICPDEFGIVDGCPDRDDDGAADYEDDCPDEPGYLLSIGGDNYGCPSDGPPPAPPTRTQVPTHNPIVVGRTLLVAADISAPPFVMIDNRGDITGFDAELLNLIAADAGFQVAYLTQTPENLFESVSNGQMDAGLGGIAISADMSEMVSFSTPYFVHTLTAWTTSIPAIQSASLSEFIGKKIGFNNDSIIGQGFFIPTDAEIYGFDTDALAFQALDRGEIDLVVASSMANLDFDTSAYPAIELTDDASYYGIVVRPDFPELLVAVNQSLKNIIANGTYAQLYEEYFGKPPSAEFQTGGQGVAYPLP